MNAEKIHKMKLGRRRAYLLRCLKAQELSAHFETDTSIRYRIFNDHIKKELNNCSYATFNNMLNEPNPQNQLDKINKQSSNI